MSQEDRIDQLEIDLEQLLDQDSYSCYEIAKVLNKILVQNDRKEIRSQMMYNYAANALIVQKQKIAKQTLRRITKSEVRSFLVRYMIRNNLILNVRNNNQLELF